MRLVALAILATVIWLGSMTQSWAQSRMMGSQCAGASTRSSSTMMMNSSPGFSAFNGNGGTMTNGSTFGVGTLTMMGGGFGSNLNFAAANGMSGGFNNFASGNAFAQGGNGFGGFDNGFGMGAMDGQNGRLSAMSDDFTVGYNADDRDAAAMNTAKATNISTNLTPRTRSKLTKSKSKSKSKSATSKSH